MTRRIALMPQPVVVDQYIMKFVQAIPIDIHGMNINLTLALYQYGCKKDGGGQFTRDILFLFREAIKTGQAEYILQLQYVEERKLRRPKVHWGNLFIQLSLLKPKPFVMLYFRRKRNKIAKLLEGKGILDLPIEITFELTLEELRGMMGDE
jgi:hypothetical protein